MNTLDRSTIPPILAESYLTTRTTGIMKNILFAVSVLAASSSIAQEAPSGPAAQAAAAPETKAPEAKWFEKVKVEGTLDAYYGYRFQGAASDKTNELRVFDPLNHTFALGYGKLAVSLPAEPAGFRLDLGFGPTADLSTSDLGTPQAEILKHIQQAYATVKLANLVTIDLGKFVTSAGAEVIEAKDNWLYTRSMLFGYAIPFAHTGLRVSLPVVADLFTLQGSVVNGWDTVFSSMTWKTFNLSAVLNLSSTGTTIYFNFYGGPQATADMRLLFDLVVNQNIGDKVALNLNGDFGMEGTSNWYGAALMGKVMLTDSIRLAARVEYFGDPQGVRSNNSLGAASYVTATLGAGFLFSGLANVEIRPELRHDQALSTTPFVVRKFAETDAEGNPVEVSRGTSASQTTIQLAAVVWF